jgi:hypothetical protein
VADILTTTRATKPGAYIGRIFRPAPAGVASFTRLPCLVGKGSRLQTVFNAPIRRSYRNNIELTFTTTAPHIANLAYDALDDQTISRLYKTDGTQVSPAYWSFQESSSGDGFDQVLITPDAFDPEAVYFIDYQSTSASVTDELPFTDLREIRFVGDGENQAKYIENSNYNIPVTLSTITANPANANDVVTQSVVVTGVSISGTAPNMTLTVATSTFLATDVGKAFTLTGATSAGNNGSFVITGYTSGTVVTYTNANGVAEAYTNTVTVTRAFSSVVASDASTSLAVTGTYTGSYNRIYTLTLGTPDGGGYIPGTVKITLGSGGNNLTAPSPFHTTEAPPANGIATGNGAGAISGTAPNMTFTASTSVFLASDVGKSFVISNATTAGNNGIFTITAYTSTTVSYSNPNGVAEAFSGKGTVVRGQTVIFKQNDFSTCAITDPGVPGSLIVLHLDDDAGAASLNDTFTFTGLGPSLLEVDQTILSNGNQFWTTTAVVPTVTNASVAVDVREDSNYISLVNRNYLIQCTAATGTSNRLATFKWVGYGDGTEIQAITTEGTFSISEALGTNLDVTLENGLKLDLSFGTVHFTAGDKFTFKALAPRKFIMAKDSRDYEVTVQTATAGSVIFFYSTNTLEGRFGTITVTGPNGSLRFPGGIDMYARNIGTLSGQNRYAASDEFTFSTVNSELIDWTLIARKQETFSTTQLYQDVLGGITNVVGAWYIILEHVPTNILYIKDSVTGSLLTATNIIDQPIVWFGPTQQPTNAITVSYEYKGAEPAPGSIYYITANIKRPAELYNVPILSLTYEEASRLLGPISTTNDLMIAAEIALNDNGAPGIYTCQALDVDQDGVVTTVDINNAILATEKNSSLTDIIVLNGNGSLSTALASNERMNDPFERKERALWWGMPLGAGIGDVNTAGTIIHTATKALQVYGDNYAHGKRVLLANSRAVKTITLVDSTTADVTLDGSFIQVAVAAKNASFTDPGSTLIRQFVSGFKSMQTFSEVEELQLIGASVLYISNQGSVDSPVFRIEDSVTVDKSSSDNNEISVAINMKEYVTRRIRQYMDDSLVGIVPPSEQAGLALVRGFLADILIELSTNGIIGSYTDASGAARSFSVTEDIEVFRSTQDRTLYHFKYWWNGRYPVKRLFGLYSVDKKVFTQ